MKRLIKSLLAARLQILLIALFAFVAVLTIGLATLTIERVISNYLVETANTQIDRNIRLARAFYENKLEEVKAISLWLAAETQIGSNITGAATGEEMCQFLMDDQISWTIDTLGLDRSHLVAVLDPHGTLLVGRSLACGGIISPMSQLSSWREVSIVDAALREGRAMASADVIPKDLLDEVGLAEQMKIEILDTPLAAPSLFDHREGTAGLALVSVVPILDVDDNEILGAILVAYFFNGDTVLVDRIRDVAGIDTVTIFFGDLRVSTNVMTNHGERAIGTRISEEVYNVALLRGEDYVGRAYVVDEWFITRYEPIFDHEGKILGSLYVGTREAVFNDLVEQFTTRVILIACFAIGLAAVLAFPISKFITQPVERLLAANRLLAQGDMQVRVHPEGSAELQELGRTFNSMVETLHETQQQLLRKETLASMGQLAAGVAHEINNPLGTILLFSDILKNDLPPDSPRQKDIEMIADETLRCKRIVSDLLNFSRQQSILSQNVVIHELIDHSLGLLQRQESFQEIRFVCNYGEDVPVIQADASQLQQVFTNLFNNAVQAMPEGGTLTVSTRAEGDMIAITVQDTGLGIPPENLTKLYTPFFTTKSLGQGTGLGLAIVYGIIKMHRGQITVSSQEGSGTTFTISLPVRSQHAQATSNHSADIIRG